MLNVQRVEMLKKPETYLIVLFLLITLAIADTYRNPEKQITGWFYVGGVRIYQYIGRPMLEGKIECRYHPTCSEYSIEAVQKHGIRYGLVLTYRRINSCKKCVRKGTLDPVPEP